MKSLSIAGASLLSLLPASAEYIWPSQYDEIEDVWSLQSGYVHHGFRDNVTPCTFGDSKSQLTAAEWLRTAYHDFATHDTSTGLGGVDASIMYELERDENTGAGFNGSLGFFLNYYSNKASMADLVALGAIVSVEACGGPRIPFRAGRIDATEAGRMGVPKPDEDIDTHKKEFAAAGFNVSDMIAVVACGHTFGGVHGNDFPQITGVDSEDNFPKFENGDESAHVFDNNVVTEYLDDSTSNPLVKSSNKTFISDHRVFSSDGNVTMKALADPKAFQSTCKDVLARMIDTVPSAVKLSDVLTPPEMKPYELSLTLTEKNTLHFEGKIRVRTTEIGSMNAQAVTLTYTDRNGKTASNKTIETMHGRYQGGTSSGFGEVFDWFEIDTELPIDTSISKFDITLTKPDGKTVYNNAGHGFPIQDSILYDQTKSCMSLPDANNKRTVKVVAYVRSERANDPVSFNFYQKIERQGVIVPKLDTLNQKMTKVEGSEKNGYVQFTGEAEVSLGQFGTTLDVLVGEGDNVDIVDFKRTNYLTQCA
ncbi:uncharacterized protein K452DRAFT_260034 [Aplosporella prunicola CBS 121167]|uniref:Peroxidase n=1 Tax=Aplosporella prunicola CBS 121167 TaxID=1176127 RepID=A0A6A6AY28_9PEZI|nr:uncharacterized protein K452DRAFT_260034 [Aplosporella prunicola CBS 121167]KAF2135864.1 hypothetical protein K452DRAFT_260034 [Aplosporella prunicola CBS 121167]